MMWAVGDEDGEGWIAIDAPSEAKARRAYADEWYGADLPIPSHILAIRVEAWDSLQHVPGAADWLDAGLSYRCKCGGMACKDTGGRAIDGVAYCEECLPDTNGGSGDAVETPANAGAA